MPKVTSRFRLLFGCVDVKVLSSTLKCHPVCHGSECALHVRSDKVETDGIAGIDPTKSGTCQYEVNHNNDSKTHPSRGTPLKSAPWFPYSAATL